jgi:hypothetical protein
MNLNSGQSVELLAGHRQSGLKEKSIGRVVSVEVGPHITIYKIDFDGIELNLPPGWIKPVQPKPSERRPPLYLHAPKDERDEASRQSEGAAFLINLGYWVDDNAKTRKGSKCDGCGKFNYPRGYQGTTPGKADMSISHKNWPGDPKVVLDIEWKARPWTVDSKPKDEREEEQLRRLQCGRNAGAWDLPSLCLAVTRFEESLGIEPLQDLLDKLA